jgi:hypothetical protein
MVLFDWGTEYYFVFNSDPKDRHSTDPMFYIFINENAGVKFELGDILQKVQE